MAVQLTKIPMAKLPISPYKPASRGSVYQARSSSNVIPFNSGKNIAFKASLDKAQMSQKFWDDLLERLRKAGGGGGGGGSFDRIKVSMQLMDFISHKMIRAMLESAKMAMLQPESVIGNKTENKNSVFTFIQNVTNILITKISLFTGRDLPAASLYNRLTKNLMKGMENILIAFSFQVNKLKEMLDRKLKKIFRKIEAGLRHWYVSAFDFFVEMKEEIKDIIYFVKNFLNLEFLENNAKIYTIKR